MECPPQLATFSEDVIHRIISLAIADIEEQVRRAHAAHAAAEDDEEANQAHLEYFGSPLYDGSSPTSRLQYSPDLFEPHPMSYWLVALDILHLSQTCTGLRASVSSANGAWERICSLSFGVPKFPLRGLSFRKLNTSPYATLISWATCQIQRLREAYAQTSAPEATADAGDAEVVPLVTPTAVPAAEEVFEESVEKLTEALAETRLHRARSRDDFVRLVRTRRSLRSCVTCINCDISALPWPVDMIVMPSNEFMQDAGWGAMQALYRQGGEALQEWLKDVPRNSQGYHLSQGDVITSDAFGDINAQWLCHACGITWDCELLSPLREDDEWGTGAYVEELDSRRRAAYESGDSNQLRSDRRDIALNALVAYQLNLVRKIFREAARVGARSIALPAVSGGSRGYPFEVVTCISAVVAVAEARASGNELRVHLVAFGKWNVESELQKAIDRASSALLDAE
jgi:O-acetyl-ADP-ribose deacetylase (regulator of RNase III)